MTFFTNYENDLSEDFIITEEETTDMPIIAKDNSEYVLTKLSEFFENKNISIEVINIFNIEINQRIFWENTLQDEHPASRKTFNFDEFLNLYCYVIPQNYLLIMKYDSIIPVCRTYFRKYLEEKYPAFNFEIADGVINAGTEFTSFDYLFKLLNMFETFLPISLKAFKEEALMMLENMELQDKLMKLREKSYIGLLWNKMLLDYLSKCDNDIYIAFRDQPWSFISSYILKNI